MYQQAVSGSDSSDSVDISGLADTSASSEAVDLSGLNLSSVDDLRNLTGAQVRALLIEQGAPETLLSQVSDEDLKTMFLQKLDEKIKTTP